MNIRSSYVSSVVVDSVQFICTQLCVVTRNSHYKYSLTYGGDQGQLSGTFTEVKQRRPRLALGWVTVREDRAL